MDGVNVRKVVTPEQYRMIQNAEFVNLVIEIPNEVQDSIRLYPMKTIEKYDLR